MNDLDRTSDSTLHVLMIVENLPVPADRRVWLEANTLKEAGYDVSIICPTGKGFDKLYENIDGINIYRHPLTEAAGPIGYVREYVSALYHEFRLARRVWKRQKFSVIHICNPPDLLFLVAGWFKLFNGVKVIFDHHDLSPELFATKFGRRGLVFSVLRYLERWTFLTANVVISTNQSYRRVALKRGRKHPDDVFVVRSAPTLNSFKRLPTPDTEPPHLTIGYIGVIAEQDGVENLIDAMKLVTEEIPDLNPRLLVVGDGPSLESLREKVAVMGLADNVEFKGFLTGTSFMESISKFDIGVCPDPKNDYNDKCTMNKILEYMALGIPVVQFDLTEGRRSAGEASLYATPNKTTSLAEKIVELSRNAELRKRMGAKGRDRMLNELSWEHSAPKLLAAYERALETEK